MKCIGVGTARVAHTMIVQHSMFYNYIVCFTITQYLFPFYETEKLSPTFEEKLWYLKNFLLWYHLMRAKTSTSRSTTMKTPPKKARAGEELELVAVHGIGVIVGGGGVVVGLEGALVVVAELVVVCGGVDGSSLLVKSWSWW